MELPMDARRLRDSGGGDDTVFGSRPRRAGLTWGELAVRARTGECWLAAGGCGSAANAPTPAKPAPVAAVVPDSMLPTRVAPVASSEKLKYLPCGDDIVR